MNPEEINSYELEISKNHISNVSNNVLNLSQNRVSALSISYISYFYHVFTLHLNSFNPLFSDVISPKLSILRSSVDTFTGLTTDIDSFICSLKPVSSYLKNYNPAQELLKSIQSFDSKTYVDEVKEYLQLMIKELDKKNTYEQIISHIYSIQSIFESSFNNSLKVYYEDFKDKIGKHKSSLEDNIKKYIQNINSELDVHCTCVKKLMESISEAINNLNTNNSNLGQFSKYTDKDQLIKPDTQFELQDTTHFGTIFESHKKYEKCLESYSQIKAKLGELKNQLEELKKCTEDLKNKLNDLSSNISDTSKIQPVSDKLEEFKTKLQTNFDEHMKCVKKLEQIGGYITTMKEALKQVEGKVKEESAKYINGLDNISIKVTDVKGTIDKIEGMKDLVIKHLKVANSASGFYKSLKGELEKLTNVTFSRYNVSEFEKNSKYIKEKLTTFEKNIKSKLGTTISQPIQKTEQKIEELKDQCPEIQDKSGGEYGELISCELGKLQKYYKEEIPKITSFIEDSSEYIEWIQIVLKVLENNKIQSLNYITSIKCQVFNLCKLNNAITKLSQVKNELNKFVELQENTKSVIDIFSNHSKLTSLSRYTKPLEQIITDSKKLIGQINYYIGYLSIIKYIDSIITWIRCCYQSKIQIIKQIIDNFKRYIIGIISKLESTNSHLCLLKSSISSCCPGYNNSRSVTNDDLGKLKDYMNNVKLYLSKIKTNFTTIQVLVEKIKQESAYIDKYQCELKKLKCVVECYNKVNNNNQSLKKIVENFLDPIKTNIIEILGVKHLLINWTFENKIKTIDFRLKCVESSINDLECAIEGVVRNMIRCSLKSLSNHLTNSTNSNLSGMNSHMSYQEIYALYSQICVMEYNVVVNRLFCSLKYIDRIFHLIPSAYACDCIQSLESNGGPIDLSYIGVYTIIKKMTSDSNINEMLKLKEIKKVNSLDSSTNHLCLCMVIKYVLYLQILKLMYIFEVDLEMLSTSSRKFDKYLNAKMINSNIGKIFLIITKLLYNVATYILLKYEYSWSYSDGKSKSMCYCTYSNDTYYHYLLSILLFVSSLIENIWTTERNSIGAAIQNLSSLLSEFDINSSDKSKTNSDISDDPFKSLFCPLKFCKLSSKLQVILDLVSISKDIPVLDSVIGPYISKISLTDPDSFKNYIQGLYNNSKNDNFKTYINWFLNNYGSIDGSNNICGQFKNQCCVLSSNIVLYLCVLIACKIKAKLYKEKCPEVKDRICKFLNCICDCKNNDCCIKELMGSKDQLCNGRQNNCEQVLKKCVDACCETKCCNDGCPCNKLKDCCDELKKLCCQNSGKNGLCKILEELSKCLKEGSCNNNCRCCCCKIVIESILIIQEMFKLNVSNISKNIMISCKYLLEMMDKIKGTNNSEIVIKLILENNIRIKILATKMSKSNYSTHFNAYSDHKNIANIFPCLTVGYGYENVYRQI